VNDSSRAKFDAAVAECRVHAAVLSEARRALPSAFAAPDVATIGSEQRRLLDQSAYRFMKLQDSLGERVLPGILTQVQEPLPPEATFAEKLQRLERLGVLASAGTWRLLREVRNSLAHEYPENPALQAAALTRLVAGVDDLLLLWSGVDHYCAEHLG
jgi:hypothetical protein